MWGVFNEMNNELQAGWAEADITPEGERIELAGQYYQRISRGIHSRLKAVVLVLKYEKEITVMISLDIVTIPDDFSRDMQKLISDSIPEIPVDKIIINAIHTHNGPDLELNTNWQRGTQAENAGREYRNLVTSRILEAVEMAWDSIQVAGISSILDFARVGHSRRAVYSDGTVEMYGRTDRDDFMGMESGEDSGVELFFFFNQKKDPIGAIVNVACPAQVMEATYKISSDYMGALREKLKKEFGNNFFMLSQISAAGCQAPRDLTRRYRDEPDFWHEDGVEVISDRLLDAVRRGYEKAVKDIAYDAGMYHVTKKIVLPKRRASYMDYINAQNEMNKLIAIRDTEAAFKDFKDEVHKNERIPGRPGPYDSKLHHYVKIKGFEAVIKRYEEQDEHPNFLMELHVIRVGDVVFASNPFELFLDFGQQIKARSQARQTFLIQLANGTGIYLPTERAERLGGYGGQIVNGFVGSDGGKKLVDETVKVIQSLFE